MINTDSLDGWSLEENPNNIFLDTVNNVEGDAAIGITTNESDYNIGLTLGFPVKYTDIPYFSAIVEKDGLLYIGQLNNLTVGKLINGKFEVISSVVASFGNQVDRIHVGNKYIFVTSTFAGKKLLIYKLVNNQLVHVLDTVSNVAFRVATSGDNDEYVFLGGYGQIYDINVYHFDGQSLSFIDGIGGLDGVIGNRVWDGEYLHICAGTKICAYSFDGANLVAISNETIQGNSSIESVTDGTYLYVAEYAAVSVYTFDGADYTLIDTISVVDSLSMQVVKNISVSKGKIIATEGGTNKRLMVLDFTDEKITEAGTRSLPLSPTGIDSDLESIYIIDGNSYEVKVASIYYDKATCFIKNPEEIKDNGTILFYLSQKNKDIKSVYFRLGTSTGEYADWMVDVKNLDDQYIEVNLDLSLSFGSSEDFSFGNVNQISITANSEIDQPHIENYAIDHIFIASEDFEENILETFLPHWWTEDPIVKAVDTALALNRNIATQFRNDINIQTASDRVLTMWEDFFGFPKNNVLTINERRARLLTIVQGGRGTISSIKAKAEEITNNPAQIFERYLERDVSDDDIFTFVLLVEDPITGGYDSDFLLEEIEKIKPAHCTVQVSFANIVEDEAVTPSETIDTSTETGFIYDDGTIYDTGKVYL